MESVKLRSPYSSNFIEIILGLVYQWLTVYWKRKYIQLMGREHFHCESRHIHLRSHVPYALAVSYSPTVRCWEDLPNGINIAIVSEVSPFFSLSLSSSLALWISALCYKYWSLVPLRSIFCSQRSLSLKLQWLSCQGHFWSLLQYMYIWSEMQNEKIWWCWLYLIFWNI